MDTWPSQAASTPVLPFSPVPFTPTEPGIWARVHDRAHLITQIPS